MNNCRILTSAIITTVFLSCSFGAMAQQAPTRAITQIADGLYRATNNNHHVVFLVTDDGVILADTVNADFSEWLKSEIDSRFGVPVRYVVYSHHHWDHASGGAVFNDTAQFVGHEKFPRQSRVAAGGYASAGRTQQSFGRERQRSDRSI